MTPAELIKNLPKREWRINNLYKIIDKDGVQVDFRTNASQLDLLENLHGRDLILKARQLGITTLMCIVALDECLFTRDHRAAIIAHKLDDAKTIFETKVKYPYDNLPPGLRERVPSMKDSADTLNFDNGSSITVTTSARSGTLQRLHVSEFGKICSQYPSKAREIVSGSFPAAERGAITIESTAEGQEGRYYDMAQKARSTPVLGPKDYRFHFYPWFLEPAYVYDPSLVVETVEIKAYFDALKADHGIELTPEQRAWWIKTEAEQGGDMKREYPSTPDEAFEQAIEGAYFEKQLAHAQLHGRIGPYPVDPRWEVNTWWDLGRNDSTTIWLHQWTGQRNRFVAYYENSGEHISHYIQWLKQWARDNGAGGRPLQFGEHNWPHDGGRQDLFLEGGRLGVADELGFRPNIVERPQNKLEAIDAARAIFASCDFDAAGCDLGLKRLRHYRKEWDEMRGVWKDRPRHDENSHGADAFQTFACGWSAPVKHRPRKKERGSAWAA